MENRIANALASFDKKFKSKNTNEAAFYMNDIDQIIKAAGANIYIMHGSTIVSTDKFFDIVFLALKAGFMIGYRKAERDYRKKHKERNT